MPATQQRTSFGRVVFVLAALVVALAGMRLAAPVLNPILFALVFAIIFAPVYAWLERHLPGWLALLGMLVGLTALFGGLFVLLSVSITSLTRRLGFYGEQLDVQLSDLERPLGRLGLSGADLSDVVSGSAIVGAVGTVLSGVGGFLSSLFLVLVIVLFLLSEGPALMGRLRASVAEDNPQVARLTFIGQGVMRQFGLRAVVNLATSVGVTILLLLLGVDFPFLWGTLTFFLSYVPYVGLLVATAPAVLLALAEFGFGRAALVVVGVVLINGLAENALSPTLMGRGLNLSPTVVFLSFVFWAWLLGGPGAFLALPLTLFAAVMLESFAETRWLASLMGMHDPTADMPDPETSAEEVS